MRIYDNGLYRDATKEEIESIGKEIEASKNTLPTESDRIDALETAIRKGMSL